MTEPDVPHLITRRRSLTLLGSTGASLFVAGAAGGLTPASAGVGESDGYVADAASACTLSAEQEEGPYYVGLDRVREDIIKAQGGLPLTLHITVINKLTCKPIKGAAVDIWHANGSGVYSDESSEDTLGETYLRGVQFTDKHGQVTFKSIYPGHYSGRTTHIHAKVHIGSHDQRHKLVGGHVSHTGQMFPPDAVNAEVYQLAPYDAETAAVVTHASDPVWTGQHGSESRLKITMAGSRLREGLIGTIVLGVNPKAVPAAVGGNAGPPTGTLPAA